MKRDTISAVLLNLRVLLNFPSCLRRFTRLQVLLALYFITLNHTGDTITISVFRRLCTFPLIQRPISWTSLPSVLARPTVRENLMNVTRSYRSARRELWRRSQLGIGRDWHRTVVGLYIKQKPPRNFSFLFFLRIFENSNPARFASFFHVACRWIKITSFL